MGLAVQKTLFEHFGETPEWRRVTGNFRHGMREVLTVAFLAQAGGARSVRQIAVWAKENEGRLRDAGLGLPYGVPSRQCLDRVFRKMPPAILRALERRWSTGLRNLEAGSVLAVDGKALKHASADGVHTPYVVSAWACDGGFVAWSAQRLGVPHHPQASAVRRRAKGSSAVRRPNCPPLRTVIHRRPPSGRR